MLSTAPDANGSARMQSRSFITFEGGEGSGKSTQLRLLAHVLPDPITITREPGGTPFAENVRHALLSGALAPLGAEAEAVAFAAARANHVDAVLRPALERGETVLCDRYVDSSRVYQKDVGSLMEPLQRLAIAGTMPDLTLIYDLEPEKGIERVRGRDGALDRFEGVQLDELHRRRAAYLTIALAEPSRCVVIDGEGSADAVHERTVAAVRDWLPHLFESQHHA